MMKLLTRSYRWFPPIKHLGYQAEMVDFDLKTTALVLVDVYLPEEASLLGARYNFTRDRHPFRNIVDVRKLWQTEQGKFITRNRTRGRLGNDDVNTPTISPNHDHQYLFPLEQELCDYYGGISYRHSCGNTTNLLRSIGQIQKLDLFHCGPWMDIASACETFRGKQTAMEIWSSPSKNFPTTLTKSSSGLRSPEGWSDDQ